MRNLIPILLALVVLSSGCDPDGYSCNSEGCYAENNAQYLTLEDCLSACDEITPNPESCGDLVSHEGYDYSTVQIGEQCWFAENCRYLPEVTPSSVWAYTLPCYYVYDYEGTSVGAAVSTSNHDTYGVLYNWPAVMTEGICPSGWHIPSDGEFTELIDFLGGEYLAGGKMKETGYDHWLFSNTAEATNASGFTGFPGGAMYPSAQPQFQHLGTYGHFWSASESDVGAWARQLNYNSISVSRNFSTRNNGFSARCVRD